MCATAGGGFSLMVEAFGFAGVSESAVVVGVFTRPGPATGHAHVDRAERPALRAPRRAGRVPARRARARATTPRPSSSRGRRSTSPTSCRRPSSSSATRTSRTTGRPRSPSTQPRVTVERGELVTEGDVADAPRGARRRRPLPALQGHRRRREHARAAGRRGRDAARELLRARRVRLRRAGRGRATCASPRTRSGCASSSWRATLVPPPGRYGPDEADVSIVCFGTTKMPALEAMKWLEAEGIAVNMLQIVTRLALPRR